MQFVIYYNLTVTVISVLVALAIGSAKLLQVVTSEMKLTGTFWTWLSGLDFETVGFGRIALFLVSWLVSLAIWKFERFDEIYPLTTAHQTNQTANAYESR